MKTSLLPLATAMVAAALVSCDQAKENAEAEALKERVEQLENEKKEAAEKKLNAKEEALAKKESQLADALKALERAKHLPPEENKTPSGPGRAVIVEENPGPDPSIAIRAAERAQREAEQEGRALAAERRALEAVRIAAEEAALRGTRCQADEHERLERAYEQARAVYGPALGALGRGGPREQREAELRVVGAEQQFRTARVALGVHLQRFHPEEIARFENRGLDARHERLDREWRARKRGCQPNEHQRLEKAHRAALAAVETADLQVRAPNLSARQLAAAKSRMTTAILDHRAAEEPFMEHLRAHHPEDYRKVVAAQERAKAERALAEAQAKAEAEKAAEKARLLALAQRRAQDEAARRAAAMEADARAEAAAQARALAAVEAARRAEEERRRQSVCDPKEHQRLRAAYQAALAEATQARAAVHAPNLNPKQRAAYRRVAAAAGTKLESAQTAFLEHLKKHHPADHLKMLADLKLQDEADRQAELQAEADAQRLAAEAAAAAAKAEVAAQAEAKRMAQEREAAQLAELARLREARLEAEAAAKAVRLEAEAARARAMAEQARLSQIEAGKPKVCSPDEHKKLAAAQKEAEAAHQISIAQAQNKNLNPKQRVYAKKAVSAAAQKAVAAQAAFEAHLQLHHPEEWKALEAKREEEAKKEAAAKK